METKIKLARDYVNKFVNNGEILMIIDEGSIVLPNHTLVDWFKDIIIDPRLENQVSICLVSKFKPYVPLIRKLGNVLSFQVNELSVPDTQTFFLQYLKFINHQIKPEDTRFFLPFLKGIPAQIIYAANLIESSGITVAKGYVRDIEEFDELRALSIFDYLKDDSLSKQILIALSRFEIISHDLINKIFGETHQVNKSIQKLFDLSLFFSVSSTHDYLKLNSSISDYITRSKLELDYQYSERIREIVKEAIQKPLDLNETSDYSEFLLTLENMVKANKPIPPRFLIPSFILKSIIREYYSRNFPVVIQLATKILDNEQKFHRQIIRETRNWLCLAYCRTQHDDFFDELRYFKDDIIENETLKDYYFLLGFYHRNGDRMDQAEKYFLQVLEIDDNHAKAKRELVNVYLRKGHYMDALELASDNYHRQRTNILHIQAYFTCLIKKTELNEEDLATIEELLTQAQKSFDKKAEDINREMQAEYDFYVVNNGERAITKLEEALDLNPNNYFAFRALFEMYKAKKMVFELESLVEKYSNISPPDAE